MQAPTCSGRHAVNPSRGAAMRHPRRSRAQQCPPPRAGRSAAEYEAAMQQMRDLVASMRADPHLARALDSPRVGAALAAARADPAAALLRYRDDPEVMAVLTRLLERDLDAPDVANLRDLGTSPAALLAAVGGDPAVAAALAAPRVRAALADIRADPRGGMQRWGGDPEVVRCLDLLQSALVAKGGDGPI